MYQCKENKDLEKYIVTRYLPKALARSSKNIFENICAIIYNFINKFSRVYPSVCEDLKQMLKKIKKLKKGCRAGNQNWKNKLWYGRYVKERENNCCDEECLKNSQITSAMDLKDI